MFVNKLVCDKCGTEWIKLDKYAASSLIERLLVGKNNDNDL